jgi:hypothetical protein
MYNRLGSAFENDLRNAFLRCHPPELRGVKIASDEDDIRTHRAEEISSLETSTPFL